MVRVAPQGLNDSVLLGLLLGLSTYLLEKQLNLGIGAAVASATVGNTKPAKAQPSPLGGRGQLAVLGKGTRVMGWGSVIV